MHAPPGNGDDLDESNDTGLTRTRARVASSEIATHRGTAESNQPYSFLCRSRSSRVVRASSCRVAFAPKGTLNLNSNQRNSFLHPCVIPHKRSTRARTRRALDAHRRPGAPHTSTRTRVASSARDSRRPRASHRRMPRPPSGHRREPRQTTTTTAGVDDGGGGAPRGDRDGSADARSASKDDAAAAADDDDDENDGFRLHKAPPLTQDMIDALDAIESRRVSARWSARMRSVKRRIEDCARQFPTSSLVFVFTKPFRSVENRHKWCVKRKRALRSRHDLDA